MIQKSLLLIFALVGFFSANAQVADFNATPTVICVGETVTFSDQSTGATTYAWTFPDGGAGQTSTLANPTITYNTAGVYDVTLVASNGPNSDTETKVGYITVLSAANATLSSTPGTDTQTVCYGGLINQIVYDVQGASSATFSNLPPSINGSFTPSAGGGGFIIISGAPSAAGVYNYSFTTAGSTCTPVTTGGVITVGAQNTLILSSGTTSQAVCFGNPVVNIEFNVGGTPDSVVVNGLPPGVTGVLSGSLFTISGTPTTTGSYVYTVTTAGSPCPPSQISGSIDVGPILELASPAGYDYPTLCINSPLPNIFYTLGSDITGATITGLPAGITGTYNPGSFLITNTPSVSGVFNYTITTSGGACGPATASGIITVDTLPTMVQDVPGIEIQTLCEGTAISDITYTIGGSATGADVIGLPIGVTGAYNAGVFTISGTPTQSGIFNFIVSTTGSPCGVIDSLGTLTVDGIPDLQLVSSVGSDTQNVCINTLMDPVVYFLNGTATDTIVSGLPPGISYTLIGDSVVITGTPTTIGVFPFMINTAGGTCPPDTVWGEITTGNPPFINLASAAGTDAQSLCAGSSLDTIVYIISGAADTAIALGLPTGVNATFSNDSLIITGSPTTNGTYNFTVEGAGGVCPNATLSGSINVFSPLLTLLTPITTIAQSVCVNTPIDTIIYVFSGGATGAIALNLPTGVTSVIQNDSILIFGTATVTGPFPYLVHTTGSGCEADSSYGIITVDNVLNLTLASAAGTDAQVVDENESIVQIVYLMNGASSANVTGLPPGVTSVVSNDSVIITGSSGVVGLYNYTVSASGGLCPINDATGTIEIQDTVIITPPPPPTPIDTNVIFVPNLFSPNDDGHNDLWVIPQLELYDQTTVTIINREGQVVFEDLEYENTWDGTYNGDPLPEATYYYMINIDDGEIVLKGAVSILRNENK